MWLMGQSHQVKFFLYIFFFLLLNVELIDLDLPLCVQLKLVIDRPCGVGKDLAVTNVS